MNDEFRHSKYPIMSQIVSNPSPPRLAQGDVILRATGLRKTFLSGDSKLTVLHSVDLVVRSGEFIAIEGRSGSGKSTMLHILGALDSADGGSVEFQGKNIQALGGAERSRLRNTEFGFVFQFYHLLPELNVLDNTMLAAMVQHSAVSFPASQTKERATKILTQFGLGERLKHRPAHLSGGERQRVAIARALMNSPKVLFADEPTGNLDADTGRQIMSVLENLHDEQGQTIVMVTHDRTLAGRADRILVLKDGKLSNPA
jgi:lipoprotein-releasing system ATP-binding protein